MWQGLVLCGLLTVGGYGLALAPGLRESGFSPLMFALLLGLAAGNLPGLKQAAPAARAGLQFATRWLLRSGIVLFGLSLTLQQIYALGPAILLLDLLVVSTVLLVGYQLGTRVLGLDRETTLLTCAGSAICGAAAVLATEATIRSRPAATAMAVATVVLFGTLAMLVYPLLYPLTGLDEGLFGIYIGATVHEVAQVVAAGDAVGPAALANAVIVKLLRVMLLVPFLLIVGQCWLGRQTTACDDEPGRLVIPWFALGFLLMVLFNSLVTLPVTLHQTLVLAGQVALAMAMAALGYETRLEKMAALGIRPFVLALCLFALLTGGGLLSVGLLAGL
ncbi:putative sulfate exporter family transporter [Stutzerimonas stutzeri]|uniref:YeiH family protein n=1 Tax=Stutzerimonas sp. S1 TaxID=3030652 RepID=UPI0022254657|nr:putative sulfate exporter family transporter [Stutzerimonas sp. S1]MCW3150528.1 putative sulfate exporter family transporter [Stutzerimonas sp. S1]